MQNALAMTFQTYPDRASSKKQKKTDETLLKKRRQRCILLSEQDNKTTNPCSPAMQTRFPHITKSVLFEILPMFRRGLTLFLFLALILSAAPMYAQEEDEEIEE